MKPTVTFFLGANTPAGFYSLYDQLIDPKEARRVYLLKGGAGCGKSTLMKRAGAALAQAGEPVEYIRCSGDPDSLDGVLFPRLGAAITDATAPHVQEPTLPGVVESYVDLGRFYRRPALVPLRGEIERATAAYKSRYKRAYRCLTAVAQLRADDRDLLLTPDLEKKLSRRAAGILAREVKKRREQAPGRAVQRFLDAISCQGVLCRFDTAEALCKRIYTLRDSFGLGAGLLTALAAGAMERGYDVILCPSPLCPDRCRHLLIPDLSLGFVTAYPGRAYRRLRLDPMADPALISGFKARFRLSRKVQESLMEEAVAALAQAKADHDRLEELYNPHVDFDGVERQAQEIIGELLALRSCS